MNKRRRIERNRYSDLGSGQFTKLLNHSGRGLGNCHVILQDGRITKDEFDEYLKEGETLGAQLIAFGKKVRKEGTRL